MLKQWKLLQQQQPPKVEDLLLQAVTDLSVQPPRRKLIAGDQPADGDHQLPLHLDHLGAMTSRFAWLLIRIQLRTARPEGRSAYDEKAIGQVEVTEEIVRQKQRWKGQKGRFLRFEAPQAEVNVDPADNDDGVSQGISQLPPQVVLLSTLGRLRPAVIRDVDHPPDSALGDDYLPIKCGPQPGGKYNDYAGGW
ncbi:hypothetical protein TYRP_012182 [Tyrophagus putrescentiae]|nr:hypothetical protein TYRP_012182 [Tyrophagus putrescentiae]